MLDNRFHMALRIAHNSPIACGVGQRLRQNGQTLATRLQQPRQRLWLHQRHIPIQDQGHVTL